MNIFFVIKYKNAQKLSSHNLFFNGFCKEFRNFNNLEKKSSPKFTILLDVGLRPDKFALVKMYNVMKNQPKIGGVCGYMGLKI
jgi:cellulose synthase/poly-beta-1,6-N-acetylglucosamine synthase-like glycosyltransferase